MPDFNRQKLFLSCFLSCILKLVTEYRIFWTCDKMDKLNRQEMPEWKGRIHWYATSSDSAWNVCVIFDL